MSKCPYCHQEAITVTSATTGCCDQARSVAWCELEDSLQLRKNMLEIVNENLTKAQIENIELKAEVERLRDYATYAKFVSNPDNCLDFEEWKAQQEVGDE